MLQLLLFLQDNDRNLSSAIHEFLIAQRLIEKLTAAMYSFRKGQFVFARILVIRVCSNFACIIYAYLNKQNYIHSIDNVILKWFNFTCNLWTR